MITIINIDSEDAKRLASHFESDKKYYEQGLETLAELKNASTPTEFGELLVKHDCPFSWTMKDVDIRFEETTNLLRVMKEIVDQINDENHTVEHLADR